MRIVFMGTPDFSVPALNALVDAGHEVAAVVTQPDRPKGRGKDVQMTPVNFGVRVRHSGLSAGKGKGSGFCGDFKGASSGRRS